MKKFLLSLIAMFALAYSMPAVNAATYSDAIKENKPLAILIYATWADNLDDVTKNFTDMQQQYGETYNFVMLNIATAETKEFNKKYYIYPNLPYVFLSRENGKVTRSVLTDCLKDSACFSQKLNLFTN